MDRFIIKRNIYRLYRRCFCFLICCAFCLFSGCVEKSEKECSKDLSKASSVEIVSPKGESGQSDFSEIKSNINNSKNEEPESKDNDLVESSYESIINRESSKNPKPPLFPKNLEEVDDLSRTYISEPSKTEEQQFSIITMRITNAVSMNKFPIPKKIENFVNGAKNLYAVALFSRKEVDQIIIDNDLQIFTPKHSQTMAKQMIGTKAFKNKPKWWDVSYNDLERCIFAFSIPKRYFYKNKNSDICLTSQNLYVAAIATNNSDECKMYFACQTGLPDRLVDNPECYRD